MKSSVQKKAIVIGILSLLVIMIDCSKSFAAGNPYELAPSEYSQTMNIQWLRDFNRQDIIEAMNHIDYLLEDRGIFSNLEYLPIKELKRTYGELQEIKEKLLDNEAYELVKLKLILEPGRIGIKKYWAPIRMEITAAQQTGGERIYLK